MLSSRFAWPAAVLMLLGVVACSGMGAPGGLPNAGGSSGAAAPSHPVGIAAPSVDDHGALQIKLARVEKTAQPVAGSEGNDGLSYQVKGTVRCRIADSPALTPCQEGLTFRVVDTVEFKFVETRLKAGGAFEALFKVHPQSLPPGIEFKDALIFFINVDPQFIAHFYDVEVPCAELCNDTPENYLPALEAAAPLAEDVLKTQAP
ncbi:MAG: hypothetical protein U1F66_00850 [bacterium]